MLQMKDDHRGHAIITGANGPNLEAGPFISSFSVWKIEPHNSFRAVLQGSLPKTYESSELAMEAAMEEAKKQLDAVLDEPRSSLLNPV
jgi:hypothetical protein